jgi:hypothetical protein
MNTPLLVKDFLALDSVKFIITAAIKQTNCPASVSSACAWGVFHLKWDSCAEVAEWQTRRSQKPLRGNSRAGSNPAFGTNIETITGWEANFNEYKCIVFFIFCR